MEAIPPGCITENGDLLMVFILVDREDASESRRHTERRRIRLL